MAFRLYGVAATFQRLTDQVLVSINDCAVAYPDDTIVFSDSWDEHMQHLRRCSEKHVSQWTLPNVYPNQIWADYLRFQVGGGQIQPQKEKVTKLTNWIEPKTKKEEQQFLELAEYYQQFIPGFATTAAALSDLTRKSDHKDIYWFKKNVIPHSCWSRIN